MIEKVTVEQRGPARAVVRLEGKHAHGESQRRWLPFTLRLYFYAGSDALRVLHTIVFDGDESRDFIRGIGLRFTVPTQRRRSTTATCVSSAITRPVRRSGARAHRPASRPGRGGAPGADRG